MRDFIFPNVFGCIDEWVFSHPAHCPVEIVVVDRPPNHSTKVVIDGEFGFVFSRFYVVKSNPLVIA